MKIIFAGSSQFSIPALEEISSYKKHQVLLAISQPPKPKGRKQISVDTPLAMAAQFLEIPIFCPQDINSSQSIERIRSEAADIIVTASYGAFLGRTLRRICPYGAINLHPSLLPKYRGPSPIRTALLSGDKVTGSSIFKLSAKMDAGPILMQKELDILPAENYTMLEIRLANLAAQMLAKYLNDPDSYEPKAQDHSLASYTSMLDKDDLHLNFAHSAQDICKKIRAYTDEPGAYVIFRGKMLKILGAKPTDTSSNEAPGKITGIFPNEGFSISTASQDLMILKVQAAGKKQMEAHKFILGARLSLSERIE